MERIKGNKFVDDRHKPCVVRIPNTLNVMFLMNDPIPDFDCLTPDRWVCYTVEGKHIDLESCSLDEKIDFRETSVLSRCTLSVLKKKQEEQLRWCELKANLKRYRKQKEAREDRLRFNAGFSDKDMAIFTPSACKRQRVTDTDIIPE